MATLNPRAFLVLLGVSATLAGAQEAGRDQPNRNRALSEDAASALSAGYRYQPPKPVEPAAKEADLRDTDAPRNQIIRLPAYIVEGTRPPVFAERNLYTSENLQKLAMARYLSRFDTKSLNRWTLPGSYYSNETRAMAEYEAQERLRGMGTMQEQSGVYRVSGDDARAAAAQEQSYSTYIRVNEPTSRLPNTRQ